MTLDSLKPGLPTLCPLRFARIMISVGRCALVAAGVRWFLSAPPRPECLGVSETSGIGFGRGLKTDGFRSGPHRFRDFLEPDPVK